MKLTRQQWYNILSAVVIMILAVLQQTGAVLEEPTTRGVTHLSGLDVTGGETGSLLTIDQTSTGNILDVEDNGTDVFTLADGGTLTFTGGWLSTLANAASGSANPFDVTATTGIMNGSDTYAGFECNITTANHTSTSNLVTCLNIANLGGSADAQATEAAIRVGSGWDAALDATTSMILAVDDVAVVTLADPPAAGAGADLLDMSVTLVAMDGSDTINLLDIAPTNGNHTGASNALDGIHVGNITGDGQATEYGIDVGTGWDRGLNVQGGGAVIVGTFTVDTGEIGATEIADVVRSIPLPLTSWVPCADLVWDSSGADAEPDLTATPGSTLAITYDDTGGSVDTGTICNSFIVPNDWISGGAFGTRATADAATVTQVETFSCAISVDGAALGAADPGSLANQTAVQTVTSTPTGTWAAGASIQVACSQGNASADDIVNFHAIHAFYTASE